jgi:hypothetical protein
MLDALLIDRSAQDSRMRSYVNQEAASMADESPITELKSAPAAQVLDNKPLKGSPQRTI